MLEQVLGINCGSKHSLTGALDRAVSSPEESLGFHVRLTSFMVLLNAIVLQIK